MINLDELSYDDLMALNLEIVERLKIMDSVHAFEKMVGLGMGAKVRFETNQGSQFGTIVKFNTKTVGVVTEAGRRWNVSPHLLTEVREVSTNSQVVPIDRKRKQKNRRK